jgi:hypothetical protein
MATQTSSHLFLDKIVFLVYNGHSTYPHKYFKEVSMARVYSNYSEEEILLLQRESEKMGLSLSAYQKYRTLLSLTDNNTIDIADLISKMKDTLSAKKEGDVFIVSSLVPNEWVSLSRSEKNTLSKALKKIVDENPKAYQVNDVLPGKINQYIVLGGQ